MVDRLHISLCYFVNLVTLTNSFKKLLTYFSFSYFLKKIILIIIFIIKYTNKILLELIFKFY